MTKPYWLVRLEECRYRFLRVSSDLALLKYKHSISVVGRLWNIVITLRSMRKCCLITISRELLP